MLAYGLYVCAVRVDDYQLAAGPRAERSESAPDCAGPYDRGRCHAHSPSATRLDLVGLDPIITLIGQEDVFGRARREACPSHTTPGGLSSRLYADPHRPRSGSGRTTSRRARANLSSSCTVAAPAVQAA